MAFTSSQHPKIFLLCNYALLGAASSCIFLTLSLRLFPSLCGASVILLHALTIAASVCGCSLVASKGRYYTTHMIATFMAAIFQISVAMLAFTRTGSFLGFLKSYVREDDAAVILKMAGVLSVIIFLLEWVVMIMAFFYKYGNGEDERNVVVLGRTNNKVQDEGDLGYYPGPFKV